VSTHLSASPTLPLCRQSGYLKALLAALEHFLGSLGVKQLVIPAVRELRGMWTRTFSMQLLTLEEAALIEPQIVFPDPESCVLLRKPLGVQAALERPAASAAKATKRVRAGEVHVRAGGELWWRKARVEASACTLWCVAVCA